MVLRGDRDADKTLPGLASVWDAALSAGVDRDAVVVGLGGGVVTDLAGFAAATLLRGLRSVACPTTLLAMVDASVGGKTAIDHPHGKNLIGAFHQPRLVLCDPRVLSTLPARQLREGLAEVAKIALCASAPLMAQLERDHQRLAGLDLDAIMELIPRAIQEKIDIVTVDEQEHGARELLNFGHTIGHAIERACAYSLPHGEAVSLGMRAEIDLGQRLGVTSSRIAADALALLDALALPRELPATFDRAQAAAALLSDKKRRDGALRLVLLDEPAPRVLPVPQAEVLAAIDRLDRPSTPPSARSIGTAE